MAKSTSGIRYLTGTSDILVIAPHGPKIKGSYQNDIRTGVVAESLHQQLGCATIINDRYFKPKGSIKKNADEYFLDLFRIDHARKVTGYLEQIREIVETDGKTIIIWLHGIADDVGVNQGQLHAEQGLFKGKSTDLHALLGYGQGGDPKKGEHQDRLSARPATIETFAFQLSTYGMTTVPTWRDSGNFRGRDSKRLNQWFNELGHGFDTVESIQLEIKEKDFRDSDTNACKTAHIIARALAGTFRN